MAGLEKQGMRVLAIPHNSNASQTGTCSRPWTGKGRAIDLEYAEARSRFEPLIEMMRSGNSEVHRSFWAADEFANFRTRLHRRLQRRPFAKHGKQNLVRGA